MARSLTARRRFAIGIAVTAVIAMALTLWAVGAIPGLERTPQRAGAQSPIDKAPVPPPAPEELGNPTDLVASAAQQSGAVELRWTPAVNADFHLVYLIKSRSSTGSYWNGTADVDGTALISNLEIGAAYWFIVIAGQAIDSAENYRYSDWSNWARATPAAATTRPTAPTPPTDSTQTDSTQTTTDQTETSRYAEFEGRVLSIDRADQSFQLRVYESEHLGGLDRPSVITVERTAGRAIPSWIRVGRFVEAEGRYYSSSETLIASELELEDDDDDD